MRNTPFSKPILIIMQQESYINNIGNWLGCPKEENISKVSRLFYLKTTILIVSTILYFLRNKRC